jgi:hypothetical protein
MVGKKKMKIRKKEFGEKAVKKKMKKMKRRK